MVIFWWYCFLRISSLFDISEKALTISQSSHCQEALWLSFGIDSCNFLTLSRFRLYNFERLRTNTYVAWHLAVISIFFRLCCGIKLKRLCYLESRLFALLLISLVFLTNFVFKDPLWTFGDLFFMILWLCQLISNRNRFKYF